MVLLKDGAYDSQVKLTKSGGGLDGGDVGGEVREMKGWGEGEGAEVGARVGGTEEGVGIEVGEVREEKLCGGAQRLGLWGRRVYCPGE